ncbi:MAG TPA: hypothetical protein PKH58_01520 [Paludibacteraceae bacterium]|nr:hypothetical protein [Paludibacteraceae bacterium]
MFVVLDNSILIHDATNIEQKSETKKKGRRTVASTAVFSRHRFELSSSDLPPLFNNQNFNVMLDKKDEMVTPCEACGQPQELTIELILKNFFQRNEAQEVKNRLWEMFIGFIGSPDFDGWNAIDRSNLAFQYKELCTLVDQLEFIHLKQTA